MTRLNRRTSLRAGAGAAGLAAASGVIGTPLIAQDRSLEIGSRGGCFEESFNEYVRPAFAEATGIALENVTQPGSTDWPVTMQQAQAAGNVPADLSLYGRATMIKASRIGGIMSISSAPNWRSC